MPPERDPVESQVIKVYPGRKVTDDRGSVSFVNDFNPSLFGVKRMYIVQNHRAGFIRAWHGHRHESKWVMVIRGAATVAIVPLESEFPTRDLFSVTLSADLPAVLQIPAGNFNGFKTLTEDTVVVFFSDKTLEESKGDDFRCSYDEFGEDVWEESFR